MKNYVWTISLIILLIATSCQQKKELTDEQKSSIIAEIVQQNEISSQGIMERNAEKAFSVFSQQEGVKYIRDGHLYPDIETAEKQYAEWFSAPNVPQQEVNCNPIIYDFIDENNVLVTQICSFTTVGDTTNQEPWVLAYTQVWRKEEDGWKLFHMHNSWE
jgi:hypothetical protein